ncbi:unnamed protein product, partial [marine sediment metagenome]
NTKPESSLIRFCVRDAYLNFYFRFVRPIQEDIEAGDYRKNPSSALPYQSYRQALGLMFERFCRHNHRLIANILRFSSVRYHSGVFFNRGTSRTDPGFQIDLIFDRADQVLTVCEIRYTQAPVSLEVIDGFEQKLAKLPNKSRKTIHSVLISVNGATDALEASGYFDKIITLKDIFSQENWE